MTINRARHGVGAFSLIELLCVLAIIGVLAALLLPALSQARARAKRVQCINYLRQTGIAFQNFAQDHNGQFPMSVPVSAGGSLEFARNAYGILGEFYFTFRHFQVLSNELVTPKLLVCPTDTRQAAINFAALANQAVSYFVGISAVPASPDSILAGDRNLTNDWSKPATLLRFGPNNALRWTSELHHFKGNLLFADGRVEERNTPGLMGSGKNALLGADLALPTVPNGKTSPTASQNSSSSISPSQGTGQSVEPTTKAISASQTASVHDDSQASPTPNDRNTSRLEQRRLPLQSLPDSALAQAQLQPGSSSNAFETNSAAESSQTNDPGFSLFPPLLGQGGMLNSTGGKWLLFILVFLLVLGAMVLLKRRLARSQMLRRARHAMFRVF